MSNNACNLINFKFFFTILCEDLCSGEDGIKKHGFILPPETIKKKTLNIWNNGECLESDNERQVSLETGHRRGDPYKYPCLLLWETFQAVRQEGRTQAEPGGVSELRR